MRLIRLANPGVRAVLRSRLHPLLSARFLLLSYQGRRSGRAYEIPLRYAALSDVRLVVVALRPERKLWWRSVTESAPVSVVLRGDRRSGTASLVEGHERDAALGAFAGESSRIARVTQDAAVVVVTLAR